MKGAQKPGTCQLSHVVLDSSVVLFLLLTSEDWFEIEYVMVVRLSMIWLSNVALFQQNSLVGNK